MISAILLAAGKSERMKRCKQLIEIDGQPMIEKLTSTTLDSKVDETILVLGYKADDIRSRIVTENIDIVLNPDFEEGMSTSLKAGLREVDEEAEAILVVLGDQPLLESELIDRLIEEYESTDSPIVAPVYKGQRGNPVLLDISLKDELLHLKGDIGARDIIEEREEDVSLLKVNTPSVLMDVNTQEDLDRVKELIGRGVEN